MASTINKNSKGNYNLEKSALKKQTDYFVYQNAPNGKAYTNHFAGNGLLMGRMTHTELSTHSCDIESYLYGIHSSTLENNEKPCSILEERGYEKPHQIYGELNMDSMKYPPLKNIQSLNIYENPTIYVPSPIQMDANPRPLLR